MGNHIWHDRYNTCDEKIQEIGNIILNLDYWDCECEHKYIHRIEQKECNVCAQTQEQSPSSREYEVQMLVKNN